MSTQVMVVTVVSIICLTVAFKLVVDFIMNESIKKAERHTEYWKGRYYALATVFDKGAKCVFSDELLEEIEKLKSK